MAPADRHPLRLPKKERGRALALIITPTAADCSPDSFSAKTVKLTRCSDGGGGASQADASAVLAEHSPSLAVAGAKFR